jgi:phosphoglycolate/pyridoxal phosphate phosphatase family enzyme
VSLADRYDGFLIDLDGVIWRGEAPVDGAAETVEALRERGKRVVFVTNNASRSARDYAAKLMRMHVPTAPNDVVTSAHAVVEHLREIGLGHGARVHVFGTATLAQVLRGAGFATTKDVSDVEACVVAWNPRLVFEDIRRACDVARSGVPFVGANRDATYPAEDGLLPGTGAILAAVEVASGRLATVVGKPAPYLFTLALERCGTAPERTLVIGDRPDSDIAGAHAAGLRAALVLTGVTDHTQVRSLADTPDVVLRELADVFGDGSGGVGPGVGQIATAGAPPAEGDDEHEPGEETADVRDVRDAALGAGLPDAAESAE